MIAGLKVCIVSHKLKLIGNGRSMKEGNIWLII